MTQPCISHPNVVVSSKPARSVNTDLLVFCIPEAAQLPKSAAAAGKSLEKAFRLKDFTGKEGQSLVCYPSGSKKSAVKARRMLAAGLGKIEKDHSADEIHETLRLAGGHIAQACETVKARDLTLVLPDMEMAAETAAQALVQGIILGDYRFTRYRETSQKKSDFNGIATIRVCASGKADTLRRAMKQGALYAGCACRARDMAHEPGNGWTPQSFADFAKNLSGQYPLKYTCLEKADMKKLGMGGLLAVNQGSAVDPKMVILEYKGDKKADTLLLVGKGITFDSGGISIKPAEGMEDMKYDMCGGAAVLSAMAAIGALEPELNVVAIVPATDNMSGSRAVRPGDIIRHFTGVTSEIVNTDAEGRMILADALGYGIKTYTPDAVVDIATLTGAVIIGLGHHHTGMIGNSDALCDRVSDAGHKAGEPVWRLPLTPPYIKQIKSRVADIKNTGGRPAGTITAAAYLSKFVGKTPWVHLDIAGTAWDYTEKSYIPKGPSGTGVRTFIDLVMDWKTGQIKT